MPKPKKNILIIGARPQEFASWRQSLQSEASTELWLCQEAVHRTNSEQDYLTHQPDCVVLANSLPDVDIMTTLAQLQFVGGANLAPVLIVTSADQEKQAQEALKHGAANYLFKEDLTVRGLRSAVYAALRQEELRRDRDSFQDSVENAPVGVHWVGPDGVILWTNQAELNLLGYTREEYIGRKVADFHTDQSVAIRMMEKLSQHETLSNFEAQLRCKDGSCRDVWIMSNVRWEKGNFIHTRCFTRDITDRKKIEAELRVRTTQLQVVSDNITTLIAQCDPEGRYRFVNQPYAQQFGLRCEQIIGKTLPEVVGAQMYAEIKPYFDAALSGQRVEFETEILGPELSKQFVHTVYIPKFGAHEEARGVIATINDITKRKLEENNQKLLLELGERIRRADNMEELLADVSALVGKQWGAARCFFSEFDLVNETVTVRHDFYRSDLSSLAGTQPLKSLSPATVKELTIGHTVINANTKTDARTAAAYESFYHPRKLEAYVGVPLLRDGSLTATMFMNHSSPRAWSEVEIGLLEIIAERTWWAVEKLRGENSIREAEENFRALVEASSQAIWRAGPHGEHTEDFAWWENLTGQGRDQFSGEGYLDVLHPEDRERTKTAWATALATRTPYANEYRIRNRQGYYQPFAVRGVPVFNSDGRVRQWIGTFTDIRERKQAEMELLTLTAKIAWQAKVFDATLSTITDYVFRFDRAGHFLYANQPLLDLWGLKAEDAIGKTLADLNYPKEVETKMLADIWQVFDHHQMVKNETPYLSPLGYDGYYEYILCPFFSADGVVEYVVGSGRDITERKKVELKLEQVYLKETAARAEAEAANRAKDEFLAVVSHELRAPLNVMLGWAKILQGGNYTSATLEHAIEVIERSARSQQKMIEDLLDSARIISGKLRLEIQPVEMTSVIEATLETVRPAAEAKGQTLEVSCLPGTDIITGDAQRLQQVVWNLISNAVKFTPPGGRISVRLKRVDPYLQLTVSDTGKGINPDFMPYIFNRFHQADSSITRRHSGLGLGLSLVRHLVELHGGTVQAESPGEDQGATFTVRLPFRAVRSEVDETASTGTRYKIRLKQLAALKGLHILVVDDELDARELVTVMLKENGAQVTAVGSVTEALRLLTNEERLPLDAIVSDIGMPEENGYTLIRQVRRLPAAQGGQLPAIALTAFGRASDRIAALSAGFQMHVPKPVEAAELVIVIASLTGRAELGENA